MRRVSLLMAMAFLGCSSPGTVTDGGSSDSGSTTDAGPAITDGGPTTDAGPLSTDAGFIDGGSCRQDCADNDSTGYQKFSGYELVSCGCGTNTPCSSECSNVCSNPSSLFLNSSCTSCLRMQENLGLSSPCTSSAGEQCLADLSCGPFLQCVEGCPAARDAGPSPDAGCQANCAADNESGFALFVGDQLQSCACATGAVCASKCTSECVNPSTLRTGSACAQCLQDEQGHGALCSIAAAGECQKSTTCEPFAQCVVGCMTSVDAGPGSCGMNCAFSNFTGFADLKIDRLSGCGCASGAPCATDCSADCASTSGFTMSDSCGNCIQQLDAGTACLQTAQGSCEGMSDCSSILSCVAGCPSH